MDNENFDKFIKTHKLEEFEGELCDALYEDGWDRPEEFKKLQDEISEQSAKIENLEYLLSTPETESFVSGVLREAGHQRWRWGDEHDMRKTAGDWFWTLGFLAQKLMIAAQAGDAEKAKHHAISSAALMANWHRHIMETAKGGE